MLSRFLGLLYVLQHLTFWHILTPPFFPLPHFWQQTQTHKVEDGFFLHQVLLSRHCFWHVTNFLKLIFDTFFDTHFWHLSLLFSWRLTQSIGQSLELGSRFQTCPLCHSPLQSWSPQRRSTSRYAHRAGDLLKTKKEKMLNVKKIPKNQ